jgi:hypothetical protein
MIRTQGKKKTLQALKRRMSKKLQNEKPLPEIDPMDTEQINVENPEIQDKEKMNEQNTQHEEEEKNEASEQSIPTTQQTVTKYGQTPKSTDKQKKRKSSIITIKMTGRDSTRIIG